MTHHADPYVVTKRIKEQENEQCQHHLCNMSVPVNHSRQRGCYHGQYRREHRKEVSPYYKDKDKRHYEQDNHHIHDDHDSLRHRRLQPL